MREKKYIIIDTWSKVFSFLNYHTIFAILQNRCQEKTYDFSDIWTISQNMLSIVLYFLNWLLKNKVLSIVCVVYAAYRMFELFVFMFNIFVFNDYRAQQQGNEFRLQSAARSILNCFHNILELIFWFAMLYSVIEHYSNTIWHYLLTSILVIANFETSLLTIQGMYLLRISALLEAGWGIFLFVFLLSKFIGGLPQNHDIRQGREGQGSGQTEKTEV